MPIIKTNSSQRINIATQAAPTESFASLTAQSKAIQGVARGVANLGIELQERRTKAKNDDYIYNSSMETENAIEQNEQFLKLEFEGNPEGYAEAKRKADEKIVSDLERKAPTEEARVSYSRRAGLALQRSRVNAEGFENLERSIIQKQNYITNVDNASKLLQQNPSNSLARNHIQLTNDAILAGEQNHFNSKREADEFGRGLRSKITGSLYTGMLLRGDERTLSNGLAMLSGRGEGPEFNQNLSPEQHASFMNKFQSQLESKKSESKFDLNYRIKEMTAFLQKGGEADETELASLMLETSSVFDKPQADVINATLSAAKDVGSKISLIQNMSARQMGNRLAALSESKPDSPDNFLIESQADGIEYANLIEHAKQRKEDMSDYISSYQGTRETDDAIATTGSPVEFQKYADERVAKMSALGSQRMSPLSKSQEAFYINQAQDPNPSKAALAIGEMRQKFGPHYETIVNGFAENKMINPDIIMAFQGVDESAITDMLVAAKTKDNINAQFTKDVDKPLANLLMSSVGSKFSDLNTALRSLPGDTSTLNFSVGLRNLVETQAKMIKNENPGMSDSDISDLAYSRIVDKNFVLIDGGNSKTLFNKKIKGEPLRVEALESFMTSHTDPEALMEMKIPGNDIQLQALSDQVVWRTKNQGNTLYMLRPGAEGRPVVVTDRDGRPVEFDIYDITNFPNQRTVSDMRSGFRATITRATKSLFKSPKKKTVNVKRIEEDVAQEDGN